MSSLVARLYLGPGPTGMVTAGQAGAAGARGPSVQCPRWAVLSDSSTCPLWAQSLVESLTSPWPLRALALTCRTRVLLVTRSMGL